MRAPAGLSFAPFGTTHSASGAVVYRDGRRVGKIVYVTNAGGGFQYVPAGASRIRGDLHTTFEACKRSVIGEDGDHLRANEQTHIVGAAPV